MSNNIPKIRIKGCLNEWQMVNLQYIFNDIHNAFVGTATPYYVNHGHLYLESNNVKNGKLNFNNCVYINNDFYNKQKNKWLHTNDIVMVQSGHVGHTAVISNKFNNTAAHALIIFANKKINADSYFINWQFQNYKIIKNITNITKGNTIKHILASDMKNFNIWITDFDEQKGIANLISNIDILIDKENKKLQKLKNLKSAMLTKMFPKKGCKVPEIRFKGFSGEWRFEIFGKLVTIDRGGSPRPIEDYITNDNNGLNWIKIGDAPKYGNYITSTKEKIKFEGLSKTREVHPNDLILSNSMSFGKPYILRIDGCIHDGWLLIRNDKNIFDLYYLCLLLSSNNMIEQYRSLAAGSTVNNLNKELVSNVEVSFPTIDEQKKIGHYFNNLDNLVEKQHQKIEKLNQIKKAFIDKMFA